MLEPKSHTGKPVWVGTEKPFVATATPVGGGIYRRTAMLTPKVAALVEAAGDAEWTDEHFPEFEVRVNGGRLLLGGHLFADEDPLPQAEG